jgi:hypothetical protein
MQSFYWRSMMPTKEIGEYRSQVSRIWRFAMKYGKERSPNAIEPPRRLSTRSRSHISSLTNAVEAANGLMALQHANRQPQVIGSSTYMSIRQWSEKMIEDLASLNRAARDMQIALPVPDPRWMELARTVFIELLGLSNDNRTLEYNINDGTVSVITEPIVLYDDGDEYNLGRFKIVIRTHASYEMPKVVALEPNTSSEGHLHPHVNSRGDVCFGEGQTATRMAMQQGRLADAFDICTSILENYSPDDSYMELTHWAGSKCESCDGRVHGDAMLSCHNCEYQCCEECMGYCNQCDHSICTECERSCFVCTTGICAECNAACRECDCRLCQECRYQCAECGDFLCINHYNASTDRCSSCSTATHPDGGSSEPTLPPNISPVFHSPVFHDVLSELHGSTLITSTTS